MLNGIISQERTPDEAKVKILFDMVFMHMRRKSHNDALVKLYRNSIFCDKKKKQNGYFIIGSQDINTPDAFDVFICSDFNGYVANFYIRLSQNEVWCDKEKAILVLEYLKSFNINDPQF